MICCLLYNKSGSGHTKLEIQRLATTTKLALGRAKIAVGWMNQLQSDYGTATIFSRTAHTVLFEVKARMRYSFPDMLRGFTLK